MYDFTTYVRYHIKSEAIDACFWLAESMRAAEIAVGCLLAGVGAYKVLSFPYLPVPFRAVNTGKPSHQLTSI